MRRSTICLFRDYDGTRTMCSKSPFHRNTYRNGSHRESTYQYNKRKNITPKRSKKNSCCSIHNSHNTMHTDIFDIHYYVWRSSQRTAFLINPCDGNITRRIPCSTDSISRYMSMEDVEEERIDKKNGSSRDIGCSNSALQ